MRSQLDELTARIEALALLAGASVSSGAAYPGWNPNLASPLLARCQDTYRTLFGREPVVESCHAGLECGIMGSRYEGMDIQSRWVPRSKAAIRRMSACISPRFLGCGISL